MTPESIVILIQACAMLFAILAVIKLTAATRALDEAIHCAKKSKHHIHKSVDVELSAEIEGMTGKIVDRINQLKNDGYQQ